MVRPSSFSKSPQLNFLLSDGIFGAMMSVSLTNEVRLWLFFSPVNPISNSIVFIGPCYLHPRLSQIPICRLRKRQQWLVKYHRIVMGASYCVWLTIECISYWCPSWTLER